MRCRTQWRVGFGGPTGLDYNAVINVMGVMGVRNLTGTLDRVQLIERGALAGLKGLKEAELWPETSKPGYLSPGTRVVLSALSRLQKTKSKT